MSRDFILSPESQKAIAIAQLKEATNTLANITKKSDTVKKLEQTKAFKVWDELCIAFKNFSDLHPNININDPMDCIKANAQTAAVNFFNRLKKALAKTLPEKIKALSKLIIQTKTTQAMKEHGNTHTKCKDFHKQIEMYIAIEKAFKEITKNSLYSYASLELPIHSLQEEFTEKAQSLQKKEEAKKKADAEKGPGCCSLFSYRKKTNDDDEALLLLNSTKK